jgi:L-iditol 2-dehydrogenase
MKVLTCYSSEDIRIEDRPVPDIGDDEVLLKTVYCGLCGTDIVKIANPGVKKPVPLGHEVVGLVEKTGANVEKFKNGDFLAVSHHIPCFDCVYCDHLNFSMCRHFRNTNIYPQGFSEYIRLSAEHIKYNAFLIEDEKYLKNAVFMEPAACCLRAVGRLNIKNGDSILVIGCGTIGIIFISLLRFLFRVRIAAVDIDDCKLSTAERFGAELITNPEIQDTVSSIKSFSDTGFDAAILTYTSQGTVSTAMEAIRAGGIILVFAGPSGERKISVDFESLYKNEVMLLSSYSASPQSCSKSFELLKDGKIDYTPIISGVFPVEDFREGLEMALSQKYFKIIYYFDGQFK